MELVIEGKPLVLDHGILCQLLYLLEELTHSIILSDVAHDRVIGGEVRTTGIHYILEEGHHLLDILLATLIVLEGLELLLCEGDLIGAEGLDLLSEDGTSIL